VTCKSIQTATWHVSQFNATLSNMQPDAKHCFWGIKFLPVRTIFAISLHLIFKKEKFKYYFFMKIFIIISHLVYSSFKPDIDALICHTTPTQKLFCLHVFRQAGSPQRVDCFASRWKIALSVRYFLRTQRRATASGVDSRFRNLSISSWRSTNWAAPLQILSNFHRK